MAIPRVLVYSHEDEPLFELDPQKLRGLVLNESINGEHSLTIDTEQELEKEQRVIVEHGGRWKEFVVTGSEERDAEDGGRSYYCAWSLQHDLSVAYIKSAQIGDAQHLHGATDAIAMVASATDRWQVGTVDSTSQSSGWFYYTSAWDALSRVVSQWAGEVDATITMSDPIRRAIDFYSEQGDQDAKRRFDYGRDLTEVQRNVLDDAFVCRIVPRGKGEQVEGSSGEPAYGRRITIESVNPTGEEWIQDDDAAMLVRLPDGSGGWEYPARIVIYEDIEEPAELLAAAQRDLHQYTRPKVGYSASVLALTGAGMDAQGVELGDAVQVVDRAFGGDGLRIEARVVGIARNLLDDYDTQLTIGNFQPSTADVIKKLERAQSSMAESVIDTDGKAEASMGIAETAQQVANAVNQHFWDDTQGAHVTEVTKDEWLDSTGPLYQSGANSLWNSLGMLFRKGLTNLMALVVDDPDDEVLGETGVAIYDGQGNASANIVASFTDNGVTLGREDESHAELDYHSLQLIDKEGSAYFQAQDLRDMSGQYRSIETYYGDGTTRVYRVAYEITSINSVTVDGAAAAYTQVGISYIQFDTHPASGAVILIDYVTTSGIAKAYTLGMRKRNAAVGGMSVAEGSDVTASGFLSHAQGIDTKATGVLSHAEGNGSVASGDVSHAQGKGTIAASGSQTVLGEYNEQDGTRPAARGNYALIIGNGTSDTSRSNALTVDWSGNVDAAGRVTGAGLTSTTGAQIYSYTDLRSTNIDMGSPPSSGETAGNGSVSFYDSAGNLIGNIFPIVAANGNIGLSFQVRRSVNGTSYYSWLRLYLDSSGNPIVGFRGSEERAAWRSALNVVASSDQSKQNARFITLTGATQVFGLWANCINANNTAYNGKEIGVIFDNGRMTLWNSTGQSVIWQLNNLSGTIDLGTTAWTTLTTGVTYRRHRGFVMMKFNNYSYTGSGTEVVLGSLPTGYRPDGLTYSALFNTSVGTTQVPYVSIAADGTVRVNGRVSGAKVYGEAVFPV